MSDERRIVPEQEKGLYKKYNIEKSDGTPVDQDAEYFVLRIDGDGPHIKASQNALRAYCQYINEHEIVELLDLSEDLTNLLQGR